jgi:mitogen-activated protein kinase kinase kinase
VQTAQARPAPGGTGALGPSVSSAAAAALGLAPVPVSRGVSHESEATVVAEGVGASPLRFRKGQAIGEGTFGRVYKGLNERTGELLAIKQLSLVDGAQSEVALLRKEIQVMWDLDHENIVRYLGTAQSDKYLFIILEYVPGGSIQSMLHQFGAFSESLICRFSCQILSGVEYLHHKGIVHRDIKGSNILVTDAGIAKLADFGCSKQLPGLCTASLEESLRAIRGSVPWMAPEVIKQSGHGRASDIWSFGATVIEMATGKPPWPEFSNNLAALFHVATSKEPPPVPAHLTPACAAFLRRCLVIEVQDRASAAELLLDGFVANTTRPPPPHVPVDDDETYF